MKLRRAARTDVGRTRDHNEDSFGLSQAEQAGDMGELLVVCDGMGGHAAGEVASKLAVETILEVYYAAPSEDRPSAIRTAFEQANAKVYKEGRGSMGTTGVAALLLHDALHVANVGDSRAYLIRDSSIRQVSRDHSFVSDQVAAGLLTPEQARISQHKNIITRALGYQPDVTVDLFRLPVQVGDVVMLTSDGLHTLVTDEELAEIAADGPLEAAAEHLVDLANERGGTDNITVVLARVDALDWDAEPLVDLSDEDTAQMPRAAPITEQITDRLPLPAAAPVAAAPVAAAPAQPAAPRERRLTLLGGLLATLMMVALLFAILFFLNPPSTAAPTPTAGPAATAQPSSTSATAAPASNATAAPASNATAAPTPPPATAAP